MRVTEEFIVLKWSFIAIVTMVIIGTIGTIALRHNQSTERIEAIKAGLVQDNKGHWVKPNKELEVK
jgi:hypothetical protein